MKKMLLAAIAAMTLKTAPAQNTRPKAYMGMGTGLEYGGIIGIKAEFVPFKYIGIFSGGGYNLHGFAGNVGLNIKFLPDSKLTPLITGMYGYNAAIVILGAPQYNKTYWGPTAGGGFELKVGKKSNKLYFSMLYPFRNKTFTEDMEALQKNPNVKVGTPLPFAFSFGFNFAL